MVSPKIMCAAKTDNLATVQIFVEKLANLKYNVLTNILKFQYSYIILEAFSTGTALSWTYFVQAVLPMGGSIRGPLMLLEQEWVSKLLFDWAFETRGISSLSVTVQSHLPLDHHHGPR